MCDQTCRRNGRRGKGGHRGRNPQRANGRINREFESEHITNRARLNQSPAEPANEPSPKSKTNANEDGEGEKKENTKECHICAEKIVYYAVGECNHRTCHICSVRLRALYKSWTCTFCKVSL